MSTDVRHAWGRTVVALLAAAVAVQVALFGLVFLGDHITALAGAAIVIATAGVIVMSLKGAAANATMRSRSPRHGAELIDWTDAFMATTGIDETAEERLAHVAATDERDLHGVIVTDKCVRRRSRCQIGRAHV